MYVEAMTSWNIKIYFVVGIFLFVELTGNRMFMNMRFLLYNLSFFKFPKYCSTYNRYSSEIFRQSTFLILLQNDTSTQHLLAVLTLDAVYIQTVIFA